MAFSLPTFSPNLASRPQKDRLKLFARWLGIVREAEGNYKATHGRYGDLGDLRTELLRGDRAALGVACFIGIYRTTRILVDALCFSHADWPKGMAFVVGHALLTLLLGLFVGLVWLRPNS